MDENMLNGLIECLRNIEVDTSDLDGQEVDVDVLEEYRKKFTMFMDDGVPGAIIAYMDKIHKKSNFNSLTRLHIFNIASQIMNKGE